MNKKYLHITLFWSYILLISCDPLSQNNVNIIVNNDTEKSFLLYAEFPDYATSCTKDTIKSNEVNFLLTKYIAGPSIAPEYKYLKLWIYNENDSAYIVCTNFNLPKTSENALFNSKMIQTVEDKKVNDLIIYNTDFIFTIDKSLISKMIKNVYLTDSVFGFKK